MFILHKKSRIEVPEVQLVPLCHCKPDVGPLLRFLLNYCKVDHKPS